MNPTPYYAPAPTLAKPTPTPPPPPSRTPGERIIAAEIQAQERVVSRLLQDEEHFRSCMINAQISRTKAEETIDRMRADLDALKARAQ